MSDQAEHWSRVADAYETEFVDPYLPEVHNPLPAALEPLAGDGSLAAADLGCGVGPLLPLLAQRFQHVHAVDFADGMLARARERCAGLGNVEFLRCALTDLAPLAGRVDVAVAVNSLVLPDVGDLDRALGQIHAALRPGGHLLGIVPAMDAVHYDFAFGEFRYRGIEQHFWQPFEVKYRLRRAGFRGVRLRKVRLAWHQFGCARDLGDRPPPWDWFFQARR